MTETVETTKQDPFPEDTESADELAVRDDSSTLELFPSAGNPTMQAADFLDQHVHMLEKAWRIADVVCQTPAAPKAYRGKPKEGTVAILYGAEVGLPPMASLQKVINVNGNPGLEARTMKGLLKAKGFKFRTITKSATEFEIWAWEPDSTVQLDENGKRINPDEISKWNLERARQAKFCPREDPNNPGKFITRTKQSGEEIVDGNMKYIEQPIEMLEAKGTADVCRSIAPEILLGLPYAAEERDDWAHDDDEPAPRQPRRGGGVRKLRERAKAAGAKAAEQAAYEEPQDAEVVEEPQDSGLPTVDPEVVQDEQDDAGLTPGETGERAGGKGMPAPASSPPEDPPSSQPIVTSEEGIAGEDLPGPGAEQSFLDDVEMSAADRTKGVAMLHGLLINGGFGSVDPDEQFAALAEIAAKRTEYRPLTGDADLSNADLKYVVNTLRDWKTKGKLTDWLGEAFNQASLREAGMLETGDQ